MRLFLVCISSRKEHIYLFAVIPRVESSRLATKRPRTYIMNTMNQTFNFNNLNIVPSTMYLTIYPTLRYLDFEDCRDNLFSLLANFNATKFISIPAQLPVRLYKAESISFGIESYVYQVGPRKWYLLVIDTDIHLKLELLAGDVETNPGPTIQSKSMTQEQLQNYQIRDLNKQVAALRRAAEKQNNFIQRQIELEKRNRGKIRKSAASKRHAQGLISAFNNAGKTLEATASHFGPTLEMAQSALEKLIEAGDVVKNAFSIPNEIDVFGVLISLFSIAENISSKSMLSLSLHCTNLARQLGVSYNAIMSLMPQQADEGVSYCFPTSDDAPVRVSQSLISDIMASATNSPHILPVTGFLALVSGVFSLMCTSTVPSPIEMTKHFGNVGRAANGFRSLKDLFLWITGYISEIYYKAIYGMTTEQYSLISDYPQLENLYAASELVQTLTKTQIHSSAAIANQIISIQYELKDYLIKASRTNSPAMTRMISTLERKMKNQFDWAVGCPARHHAIRAEPVSLYLYGRPGTGKSVLTEIICAKLYAKYLKQQGIQYASATFVRKAVNEFWEGYVHQPIVILDDFANSIDSVQNPLVEYDELINMVNTTQYPLHMAAMEAKADTYFDSKYVIASSNQKSPAVKSKVDPGAIFRRFHMYAEVNICEDYGVPVTTGNMAQPTYYKYDANVAESFVTSQKGIWDADNPLRTEHYRITLYQFEANTPTNFTIIPGCSKLTFEAFFDKYISLIENRLTHAEKLQSSIRKLANIDTPVAVETEKAVMDHFRNIFNPDAFIDAMCDVEEKNETVESTADRPVDAGEGSAAFSAAWDEWDMFESDTNKRSIIKEKFNALVNYAKDKFKKITSRIKQVASAATNKFLGVANFLFSFFKTLAGKAYDYLPSTPTSPILVGICTTLCAVLGVWCTGMFHSKSVNNSDSWCKFARAPSDADTPCRTCAPCLVISYPAAGNMLDHFLTQVAVKQVHQEILALGFNELELSALTTSIWRRKLDHANQISSQSRTYETQPMKPQMSGYAQGILSECIVTKLALSGTKIETYAESFQIIGNYCWFNCSICPKLAVFTYNPLENSSCIKVANDILSFVRSEISAQSKVYDTQPRQMKMGRYSQASQGRVIEAKTDIHIGSTIYAQRDRVQVEQTTQVLLNNSVWIQVVDEAGMASKANGVFLVGRTMVTTAHTVMNPPSDSPIASVQLFNPYTDVPTVSIPYSDCKISQMKQLDGALIDLALVSFPSVVPNRPKILSKFINSSDIDALKEGQMVFSGFYQHLGKTVVQEKHPLTFKVSSKIITYNQHECGHCPHSATLCTCEPVRIGNHIEYDIETSKGMCGALLSVDNKLVHSKLIGFHVAGGSGFDGLGALTTRQLLETNLLEHVTLFAIPERYLIDGRLPYSQSWVDHSYRPSLVELGDCLGVGAAQAVCAPTKTQLQPSAIFDQVQPHITKPALLIKTKVGDTLIDPLNKGILKVLGPQTYIDNNMLDAAINDVFDVIGKGSPRILSYEESIKGVEGDNYMRPVNRSTSPGYPYNLNNPNKGKTHWLGSDEIYDVNNKELKNDVEKLILDSSQYVRGNAISIATLKDEKRPLAKVDAGKTRVFEACPQHLVLAIRQYYLSFIAHVMSNRIENEICVGINPYSLEWTKLAHHLQTQGNNVIAGDFSNFDGSLSLQIVYKIAEKINEWYGDDPISQATRITLWEHICNADVLVRDEVIRQTHSQPSGNPLTVIVNSIFNSVVMRLAYMKLKMDQGYSPRCDFTKYVANANYGDDNVLSIHHSILSWYNQETISAALSTFGLTYTDEVKSGELVECRTLEDVAFLKRKFVLQKDGTFLAPMDLANTLEITNWIRGKAIKQATLENCECTLMELSLHPPAIYNTYSKNIKEACGKVGLTIKCPTHWEWMEDYRYNRDKYSLDPYTPLW